MPAFDDDKIGRNSGCPCGSGVKYKNCCLPNKTPWEHIRKQGFEAEIQFLSSRGKNLFFYGELFDALQIDPFQGNLTLERIKRGFTPQAVQRLYSAVGDLWPNARDLNRVLLQERKQISGLYVGMYEHSSIVQGVKRHSLYSDSILLIDPFMHPLRFRDDLNPLLHPERHRSNALKAALLWLNMFPWVEAGIVRFVRTPADYSRALLLQTIGAGRNRTKENPELEKLLKDEVDRQVDDSDEDFRKWFFLSHPDKVLFEDFIQFDPEFKKTTFQDFSQQMAKMRAAHPYYLDPSDDAPNGEEFLGFTSGANYDLAKHTALLSGSHLITDIAYRWREIELDREKARIDEQGWSPFAKALRNAQISYLKDVPLQAAYELRQKGRLEHMRHFFRKVWKSASSAQPFDTANAANLAAELDERVREAKGEFDKIKQDLTAWLGATAAASVSSAWFAPASMGTVGAATGIIGGVASLAKAQMSRTAVEEKFPASFFLKLKEE